jgi:uncharacterized protein (DUF2141 family)
MTWTISGHTVGTALLTLTWLLAANPATARAQAPSTSELVVVVVGLESDDGAVRLALFDDPAGFTDEPVFAEVSAPTGRTVQWRIRVPYGRYAVAAIHDSDGDGRLDTNFLGMPQERYGFSNGARGTFGPPSFADASFPVDRPSITLTVEVR